MRNCDDDDDDDDDDGEGSLYMSIKTVHDTYGHFFPGEDRSYTFCENIPKDFTIPCCCEPTFSALMALSHKDQL